MDIPMLAEGGVGFAMILAICQGLKSTPLAGKENKLIPIWALGLGIVIGVGWALITKGNIPDMIIKGAVMGLTAVGAYSAGKGAYVALPKK